MAVAPQNGVEWLTTRLAKKVKLLLTIEAKIAGMEVSSEEVRFEVSSEPRPAGDLNQNLRS